MKRSRKEIKVAVREGWRRFEGVVKGSEGLDRDNMVIYIDPIAVVLCI